MADYYFGRITIDPLYYYLDEKIKEMMDEYAEDNDNDDEALTVDETEATLCCSQARYGSFQKLEDYLIEHKIPFERMSDPAYEYLGEIRTYDPQSTDPEQMDVTKYTNSDGCIIVTASALLAVFKENISDAEKIEKIKKLC